MRRTIVQGLRSVPWWCWVAAAVLLPVCALNATVSWLGDSQVSLLSPFFLREKASAVGKYVAHRPRCLIGEHPEMDGLIRRASDRHGIPPGLLASLIHVESESRPHRISRAGAMGPAQLMPDTAALLKVEDPFDSASAVEGSARYLAAQVRRFGDLRLAIAAYNAGPGAVRGRVPQNGETEHYVAKVMAEYQRRAPPPPRVETKKKKKTVPAGAARRSRK